MIVRIAKRLRAEYLHFAACTPGMRLLLFVNVVYALVLPVIEIFVAAYIMHSSSDVTKVMVCQLSIYTAIPLAFYLNGFLLRYIDAARLYATGITLSGCALFAMLTSDITHIGQVIFFGGLIGLATGLFWANRGFLVLMVTDDKDRNYFYGLELSFATVSSLLVPLIVGVLVSNKNGNALNRQPYATVAFGSLALTIIAASAMMFMACKRTPEQSYYTLSSHPLWHKMLVLAGLKGLGQGYIVTLPAVLIMSLVGKEDTLGMLEACASALVAVALYIVGRKLTTQHRSTVFSLALVGFFFGSLVNAALSSVGGVIVLVCCMLVTKPFIELAYYPIQFLVTEVTSKAESRSCYSYIFSHECGTFFGRVLGCSLFLVLASLVSSSAAMFYALPMIAGLQLLSIPLARQLSTEASLMQV